MPTTTGMKGEGFYDEHSSGQRASIESLASWIDAAAAAATLPRSGRPFVVVDFGSSEGRNSVLAMRRVIGALRSRGAQGPICPVFTDLVTNNFNQLFRNVAEDDLLRKRDQGIFPAVIGGSFYTPLLPPGTVHLGLSFNSVLWLDRLPDVPFPEFIVYMGPRSHRPDVQIPAAAVEAFSLQAAHDLVRFLDCRAAEIAQGARLLVAQPARDHERSIGEGLYDLLHDACLDLVQEKQLNLESYQRVTMPIYFRSLEEMLAPVDAAAGALRDRFSIERAEVNRFATPFAAEYARTGDVDAYVDAYVGFAQAFTEPILRAGLDVTHGPQIVPAIYERMKQLLRAAPQQYEIVFIQATMLLQRR
jgi:SAM dependent carboxyl methyltransferase